MSGVLFPDVEAYLIGALAERLAARSESYAHAAWVGNVLPNPRPARAVLVRDDGGPVLGDVRALARVGVNVWADDLAEVVDLGNLACALLGGLAGDGPVRNVTVTRPYRVPDDSGQPHVYFTAELTIRSTTVA